MAQHKTATPRTITIDAVANEPYNRIIAYPNPNPEAVKSRVKQIERLGVESIVFSGLSDVNGVPILGKGCVGIVLEARSENGRELALKIRRTDANRQNMHMEAQYQTHANLAGIGPRLDGETEDVLSMDLVKGETLPRWVSHYPQPAEAKRTLRSLIEQSFMLDKAGLDHGELSHAHKNVLVTHDDPVIIDFESSSLNRRPGNLTSIIQYLLISGRIAERVRSFIGFDGENKILLDRLRQYKTRPTRTSLEDVVYALRL